MDLLTMFAILTLLDMVPPPEAVAMFTGVLVLAGIFFSLGVFSLGRWTRSGPQTPETEPPSKDGSSPNAKRIVVGGIAVWVILTLGILAIPHGRRPSNDSGAVANLRTINTAQVTYMSRSRGDYARVQDLIDAGLLDARFSGTVGGYDYAITLSQSNMHYVASAVPAPDGGRFGYYSVPDGVVRYGPEPDPGPERVGQPVQ